MNIEPFGDMYLVETVRLKSQTMTAQGIHLPTETAFKSDGRFGRVLKAGPGAPATRDGETPEAMRAQVGDVIVFERFFPFDAGGNPKLGLVKNTHVYARIEGAEIDTSEPSRQLPTVARVADQPGIVASLIANAGRS